MNPRPRILSLGELLWDLLPSGPQLGGAPANFACHSQALGAEAGVVSRVGQDLLGEEALRRLRARALDLTGLTTDPHRPTGTVAVELAADGQPRFQIVEHVAWDALPFSERGRHLVADADAVCFGSLGQRSPASRDTIQRLVAAAAPGALRVFDINLRAPFHTPEVLERSLELADVLKLNEGELPELAAQFGLKGPDEQQVRALADRFDLKVVALTLGAAGSHLLRDGEWSAEPGRSVAVQDTIGAGDAFTAALVMGLLRGWPTPRLLAAATDIAAFVCTRPGATPELPPTLVAPFRP